MAGANPWRSRAHRVGDLLAVGVLRRRVKLVPAHDGLALAADPEERLVAGQRRDDQRVRRDRVGAARRDDDRRAAFCSPPAGSDARHARSAVPSGRDGDRRLAGEAVLRDEVLDAAPAAAANDDHAHLRDHVLAALHVRDPCDVRAAERADRRRVVGSRPQADGRPVAREMPGRRALRVAGVAPHRDVAPVVPGDRGIAEAAHGDRWPRAVEGRGAPELDRLAERLCARAKRGHDADVTAGLGPHGGHVAVLVHPDLRGSHDLLRARDRRRAAERAVGRRIRARIERQGPSAAGSERRAWSPPSRRAPRSRGGCRRRGCSPRRVPRSAAARSTPRARRAPCSAGRARRRRRRRFSRAR